MIEGGDKNYKYMPIIGLEVHIELKTESKMFCGCSASYFGHEPNTFCCPVCLGLPGALPIPNEKAIKWCIMLGLALNCKIPLVSKFDRKNYFYPDLPKGYQISQYDMPFCVNGWLKIKSKASEKLKEDKQIRIRRVHLEEDTGKLIHAKEGTLIDFNRSGVPLVEIVTEPDLSTAFEAKIFLQKLQQIARYLGISDADMEKGSMRCEPNISIKTKTDKELPNYKVEIKNINSFRFAERAIDYEIKRQIEILEKGGKVVQETRGFDSKRGVTLPQRRKEEAQDYRYFPEPDIPPIYFTKAQILELKTQICELPDAKFARFLKDYGLSEYDANILTTSLPMADYFEEAVKIGKNYSLIPKQIANVLINRRIDIEKILPFEFIKMILQRSTSAKISANELEKAIKKTLLENQKAINDYKKGKTQALMFLVGQVLKETKGMADPEEVKEKLEKQISEVKE